MRGQYRQWTTLWSLRRSQRLTRRELAEHVGCSLEHIRDVECGRRGPSEELIDRLADCFGVEPVELELSRPVVPHRGNGVRPPRERAAEVAS